MPKQPGDASLFLAQIRFVGRSDGLVRTLPGFRKSHHTVPDAVNAATSAFLARLAADELAAEAENFFQRARAAFAYKRKDLSVDLSPPTASLTGRDFSFELAYALSEADPAQYVVTRTLYGARSIDFLSTPECAQVFAGIFSEIVFALRKGARVEALIDLVEGLDDSALRVSYPSDCRECTLAVPGVAAEVRFDGSELAVVFPRKAAPRELIDAFLAVRAAFQLTKDDALAVFLS